MRPPLTLELLTFDPGLPCPDAAGYARAVGDEVERAWDDGADLVLLPEFTWMGLEPFAATPAGGEPLAAVAGLFWQELWPALQARLARPGKAVVLGTVPCREADGGLRNRAPILADGQVWHQDKLHLTPWEQAFAPGDRLLLWEFGGFRIAVIICLDIEIPELSARLRGAGVDLVLCPSATETLLGVERVDRCASARAVELGCYVGVAHLTGQARSALVDDNVGRVALYKPSQSPFRHEPRWQEGEVRAAGVERLRVALDAHALDVMRRLRAETNPAQLGQDLAGLGRPLALQSTGSASTQLQL